MLDDILQMLMQAQQDQSNSDQSSQPAADADNPLGDMLGGLLGSMAGQSDAGDSSQASNAGGMDMGMDMGMLGGLFGMLSGGSAGEASGVTGGNPMLAPITEAVSEKLGISPQMAGVVVSAGFALLMSKMQQSGQANRSGSVQDLDLDELTDAQYLHDSGMATRVAEQTGVDEDTAVDYLQQTTKMMTDFNFGS